jgi:hypothetical protein
VDPNKKNDYKQTLLSLIPAFPQNIGNSALRTKLRSRFDPEGDALSDDDYWELRNSLIDDGLIEQGRGRGGSVHRIAAAEEENPKVATTEEVTAAAVAGITKPESALYEPFHNSIKVGYVQNYRINTFISEINRVSGEARHWRKMDTSRPDVNRCQKVFLHSR